MIFVYFSMYFYIKHLSYKNSTFNIIIYGGVAQLARAPALQAGGQEFDSPHLHQVRSKKLEIRCEKHQKSN